MCFWEVYNFLNIIQWVLLTKIQDIQTPVQIDMACYMIATCPKPWKRGKCGNDLSLPHQFVQTELIKELLGVAFLCFIYIHFISYVVNWVIWDNSRKYMYCMRFFFFNFYNYLSINYAKQKLFFINYSFINAHYTLNF